MDKMKKPTLEEMVKHAMDRMPVLDGVLYCEPNENVCDACNNGKLISYTYIECDKCGDITYTNNSELPHTRTQQGLIKMDDVVGIINGMFMTNDFFPESYHLEGYNKALADLLNQIKAIK